MAFSTEYTKTNQWGGLWRFRVPSKTWHISILRCHSNFMLHVHVHAVCTAPDPERPYMLPTGTSTE